MSELETEYADRANFVVIPPEETAAAGADLDKFGFTELKHGLVIFDASGEPVVKMPGHSFGRAEIEEGLQDVL